MREIVLISILVAVSHTLAGFINAEKWVVAEMNERFERAKRDGYRIESNLHMQPERVLFYETD